MQCSESRTNNPNIFHLVHVVRRYGPVGGMERYVWELTLHLRDLGHSVTVVCERCHVPIPEGISVVELGEVAPRPRWVAAFRFSHRVAIWIEANPSPDRIIHSHERLNSHDITTFHGSIFATVFEKPWWHWVSLRVAMQLFLERRELTTACFIIPNSLYIKHQLEQYYPNIASKLTDPVTPGVTAGLLREFHRVPSDGGVIGFVGEEWKRKGLPLAVAIVKQLQISRPNLQFIVVGPASNSVKFLFSDWQAGYVLKEWDGQVNYSKFDVLIHPAKSEPYGMVISEAMSAKVPVVISNACGSCDDVSPASGSVLPIDASIELWVEALNVQLCRTEQVPEFSRSWLQVAQEYEQLYQSFVSQKCLALADSSLSHPVGLVANLAQSSTHISTSKHN